MLFKFKTQAASDLIMLEVDARKLLQIILGNDPLQGIVLARDIPAAIIALETAVAQDEAQRQVQLINTQPACEGENHQDLSSQAVSLARRAVPMLKLLKLSMAHEVDVVWGV